MKLLWEKFGKEAIVVLRTIISNAGTLRFIDIVFIVLSYMALIFVMLPLHELAHAWVATKLGDNTARWHGRLSFNPLAHLDLWGTLCLVLFGFGFARAVPVNPRNFRNPKRDMAITAAAGPVSNLLMAFASLLLFRVLSAVVSHAYVYVLLHIVLVQVFASVNLGLAVFNLLPVPPLDGSRIFAALVPSRWSYWMDRYHQYLVWGVLLLVAMGALSRPLGLLVHYLGGVLCAIVGLPNYF